MPEPASIGLQVAKSALYPPTTYVICVFTPIESLNWAALSGVSLPLKGASDPVGGVAFIAPEPPPHAASSAPAAAKTNGYAARMPAY
jgi:hypothetical protein